MLSTKNLFIDDVLQVLAQQSGPDDRWALKLAFRSIGRPVQSETPRCRLAEEGLVELLLSVGIHLADVARHD